MLLASMVVWKTDALGSDCGLISDALGVDDGPKSDAFGLDGCLKSDALGVDGGPSDETFSSRPNSSLSTFG